MTWPAVELQCADCLRWVQPEDLYPIGGDRKRYVCGGCQVAALQKAVDRAWAEWWDGRQAKAMTRGAAS